MKTFNYLSLAVFLLAVLSSTVFATTSAQFEETLERKSSLEIEVPEEYRKELNITNHISWEIENEDIVYFTSYENFNAEIMGLYYGSTTVTCSQGDEVVAQWNITVPGEPPARTKYDIYLNKEYLVQKDGITEAVDVDSLVLPISQYENLVFEPDNLFTSVKEGGTTYVINPTTTGTFLVDYSNSMAGTGARKEPSPNGGIRYSNGGAFHWVEPLFEVTIHEKEPVQFEKTVARKSNLTLEVPDNIQQEISQQNYITWSIEDDSIVSLTSCNDFESTYIACNYGTTTITFSQGGEDLAVWTVTVPEETITRTHYDLYLNKNYIVSETGITKTTQTEVEDALETIPPDVNYTRFIFTPNNLTPVLSKNTSEYLITPVSTGNINIDVVFSLATGAASLDTHDGHYIYESGTSYSWRDPIYEVTIHEKEPAHFEETLERKSSLEIEVPEEYRKELNITNHISWEIENEDIVYFTSYENFNAKIMGLYYGSTTVTCSQGDEVVAQWTITVPGEPPARKKYDIYLNKEYLVDDIGITEAVDVDSNVYPDVPYENLIFEPDNLFTSVKKSGTTYVITPTTTGTFLVDYSNSMAGTGPLKEYSANGGVRYSNGGAFHWVEPLFEVTIHEKEPAHFEETLERKSSLQIEVPEENRKELNISNHISWEIENEDIVYFTSYENFNAEIMGLYYGSTTVTCSQGDEVVAQWNITVPGEPPARKKYDIYLNKEYLVDDIGITEAVDVDSNVYLDVPSESLIFEPDNLFTSVKKSGTTYVITPTTTGIFLVDYIKSMAGTGPLKEYSTNGGVSYSNGGAFRWVEPLFEVTIHEKLPGDIDDDGEITIIDVRLLLQSYINHSSSEWSSDELETMDVDGNNNIDIVDVRLLLQTYINSSN